MSAAASAVACSAHALLAALLCARGQAVCIGVESASSGAGSGMLGARYGSPQPNERLRLPGVSPGAAELNAGATGWKTQRRG
jgi:hypothetical protein